LNIPSAYLLVAHGSRDPRPARALAQLRDRIQQRRPLRALKSLPLLQQTPPAIDRLESSSWEIATLELAPTPLHQQIQVVGETAVQAGYQQLQVVPLFLLPGTHVMQDIPSEVAIAQAAFRDRLQLFVTPHLGTHPGLATWLQQQMRSIRSSAWILLAHGSRRPDANQPIEDLARTLGAIPAYWAITPDLSTGVRQLVAEGHQAIGILPYFLFAGGITDAIAHTLNEIAAQFPTIQLQSVSCLDASPELPDWVLDLVTLG
jgi:sirohydrochlorin cobaltochelatase